jgi:hypothetical protein
VTLEELAQTLPNGLHDAEFQSIFVDYARRQVVVSVSVWVGDMDEGLAPREGYRDGELLFEGLQFIAIEPPDARYPFAEGSSVCVDLYDAPLKSPPDAVSRVPADCFAAKVFVREWNSSIYIAARSAKLSWKGETYDRDRKRSRDRSREVK